MAYSPTELLTVYLDSQNQRRKIGRLAFKERQILSEYDASFLTSGIEISPIKLPLRPGVYLADTAIFDGLFGVFNDSLPDGWGRTPAQHRLGALRPQGKSNWPERRSRPDGTSRPSHFMQAQSGGPSWTHLCFPGPTC